MKVMFINHYKKFIIEGGCYENLITNFRKNDEYRQCISDD